MIGRSVRAVGPPPWLTSFAAARLAECPPSGYRPTTPRLPGEASAVWASLNKSNGITTDDGEHRAGVEVRDPFADSELVSFMLSVPAYMLYNQGASKLVLRVAMASLLPSVLLTRPTRSDISPLFWRGVGPGGSPATTTFLERAEAFWGRYVRADVLLQDAAQSQDERIIPAIVQWRCLGLEWGKTQSTLEPAEAA